MDIQIPDPRNHNETILYNTQANLPLYRQFMSIGEKALLKSVLHHTNYNKVRTSKILGINRMTLGKKIKVLNIVPNPPEAAQ